MRKLRRFVVLGLFILLGVTVWWRSNHTPDGPTPDQQLAGYMDARRAATSTICGQGYGIATWLPAYTRSEDEPRGLRCLRARTRYAECLGRVLSPLVNPQQCQMTVYTCADDESAVRGRCQ